MANANWWVAWWNPHPESPVIEVVIYTDGACRGNPGPGGWGVVMSAKGTTKELWGGELETTNNRMELCAAIEGLRALKRPSEVILYTDSRYVLQGITEWIINWKKRDWRTSGKKPVKNEDLWKTLDRLNEKHQVTWKWVKGHDGVEGNERADWLANRGADEAMMSR